MTRPIIWIVGGQDKGNDYSPLLKVVKEKVKAIVCMGLDNEKHEDIHGILLEHPSHPSRSETKEAAAPNLTKSNDPLLYLSSFYYRQPSCFFRTSGRGGSLNLFRHSIEWNDAFVNSRRTNLHIEVATRLFWKDEPQCSSIPAYINCSFSLAMFLAPLQYSWALSGKLSLNR